MVIRMEWADQCPVAWAAAAQVQRQPRQRARVPELGQRRRERRRELPAQRREQQRLELPAQRQRPGPARQRAGRF